MRKNWNFVPQFFGMLAMLLAFGMVFVGCSDDSGSDSSSGYGNILVKGKDADKKLVEIEFSTDREPAFAGEEMTLQTGDFYVIRLDGTPVSSGTIQKDGNLIRYNPSDGSPFFIGNYSSSGNFTLQNIEGSNGSVILRGFVLEGIGTSPSGGSGSGSSIGGPGLSSGGGGGGGAVSPTFVNNLPDLVELNLNQTSPAVSPLLVTVTVPSGVTYQWYRSTTTTALTAFAAMTGETGNAYIPPVAAAGTVYYLVEAKNSAGTRTSNIVKVVVGTQTTNVEIAFGAADGDDLGSAADEEVENGGGATALTVVTDPAGADVGHTLAYKWYMAVGGTGITAANASYNRIPGQSTDTYTPDTDTNGTFYYYIEVTYSIDDDSKNPRTIKSQVATITVADAMTGTLAVTRVDGVLTAANITAPVDGITYTWTFDGQTGTPATGATLNLANNAGYLGRAIKCTATAPGYLPKDDTQVAVYKVSAAVSSGDPSAGTIAQDKTPNTNVDYFEVGDTIEWTLTPASGGAASKIAATYTTGGGGPAMSANDTVATATIAATNALNGVIGITVAGTFVPD